MTYKTIGVLNITSDPLLLADSYITNSNFIGLNTSDNSSEFRLFYNGETRDLSIKMNNVKVCPLDYTVISPKNKIITYFLKRFLKGE